MVMGREVRGNEEEERERERGEEKHVALFLSELSLLFSLLFLLCVFSICFVYTNLLKSLSSLSLSVNRDPSLSSSLSFTHSLV
jgi:hypothetical protein